MQLTKWMDKEERNAVWVGNQIGVPDYQVRRTAKDGSGLTAKFILDVANLTNGEVNINDWVKLEKKRKTK